MAKASATIHIAASAQKVWELTGGFQALPNWLPMIVKSEQDEGGRLRKLTAQDGAEIDERLEFFDNKARTYSYSITRGPFPVTDYFATFKVTADGENASLVEWGGSFTPDGISEAEAEELFRGVYEGGLEALKKNF